MNYNFDAFPCYYVKTRWAESALRDFYNSHMNSYDITGRQFTLLTLISTNEGCSVRELADMIVLERSTVNRSILPLFKKRLIVDRKITGTRNSQLAITEEGINTLVVATKAWEKAQNSIETKFGKDEIIIINRVLKELGSL